MQSEFSNWKSEVSNHDKNKVKTKTKQKHGQIQKTNDDKNMTFPLFLNSFSYLACGLGSYARPLAQFFPMRTDQGWWTYICSSSLWRALQKYKLKKKKKKRKQSAQSCKCLQVKWLLFSFSDWKYTIKWSLLAITKSCHLSFSRIAEKIWKESWF